MKILILPTGYSSTRSRGLWRSWSASSITSDVSPLNVSYSTITRLYKQAVNKNYNSAIIKECTSFACISPSYILNSCKLSRFLLNQILFLSFSIYYLLEECALNIFFIILFCLWSPSYTVIRKMFISSISNTHLNILLSVSFHRRTFVVLISNPHKNSNHCLSRINPDHMLGCGVCTIVCLLRSSCIIGSKVG